MEDVTNNLLLLQSLLLCNHPRIIQAEFPLAPPFEALWTAWRFSVPCQAKDWETCQRGKVVGGWVDTRMEDIRAWLAWGVHLFKFVFILFVVLLTSLPCLIAEISTAIAWKLYCCAVFYCCLCVLDSPGFDDKFVTILGTLRPCYPDSILAKQSEIQIQHMFGNPEQVENKDKTIDTSLIQTIAVNIKPWTQIPTENPTLQAHTTQHHLGADPLPCGIWRVQTHAWYLYGDLWRCGC